MNRYFIITIDTEGDNIWKIHNSEKSISRITNKNGLYIERFQILCEKYGFAPTYLTNYEMAMSDPFVELAKAGLQKKALEVGMHLHAFNNPPFFKLDNRGGGNKSYAGEYPQNVLEQKIDFLTKLLEDTFQTAITSHRGGRWYLDQEYLKILIKYGYKVDCTVTPGVDWRSNRGQTEESKGINYRNFPVAPYELSVNNIARKGNSGILEVPVTIIRKDSIWKQIKKWNPWLEQKDVMWLRPNGKNLEEMIKIVDYAVKKNYSYIEFMLHSSELMPGGSPTFLDEKQIENLYETLGELFDYISLYFKGIGLTEYAKIFMKSKNYSLVSR